MNMRSSRATRGTNVAKHVFCRDMIAFFCRETLHVQVNRLDALSVIDGHCATAQIPFLDDLYNSRRDRMNGRPGRAALIEAGVEIAGRPSIVESEDTEQRCQAARDGRLERLSPIANRGNGLAERANGLLLAGRWF